ALVGLALAQIPRRTRAAHHHARKAPGPGILQLDDTDADVALFEDAVVGEQHLQVIERLEERINPLADVLDELLWQILMHAARPEIGRMHARTGSPLVEDHELLALLEAPERRSKRADVHRLRGDVQEMVQNAADFAIEHADELPPDGHVNAQKPLHSKRKGMLLVHRRDIVEPVEIGNGLQIGLVLDQLFRTAVEEPDMRVDALDHLAVKFEHEAQNAMRGRMLRTEIDVEVADCNLSHATPSFRCNRE